MKPQIYIVDKYLPAFAVGFGHETEKLCKTNQIGPEIYKECAKQTLYAHKGER